MSEGTLLSHLVELRSRLLKIAAAVVVIFVALLPFSRKIFSLVSEPLRDVLPGNAMIATQVASPLLTPFKMTFFAAFFIAMPVVLYQIWSFVAPGLYKKEKRFAIPLLASSIILFYMGIAFAYFVVFPLMFGFFTAVAPEGVEVQTDIAQFLDFITTIVFAFGLAFEVPVATVLIVWTGLTTPDKLGKARPYVFLGAFIMGMFLTPPDVISQTLLAVPVYLLYELGIIMSRIFSIRKEDTEDDEPDTD
ncbi:MAG: twin-arginine translocase subunit TatC [Gammaproteobacteria bacterium]|nr:MAG: twin-arginine translocase subunit TatC [Gammaproteobacteria bacterium]